MVHAKVTVFEYPPTGVRVSNDVAGVDAVAVTMLGVAVTVKSGAMTSNESAGDVDPV